MRLIETVIGARHDESLSGALHRLEHRDQIDVLAIDGAEQQRRRFRATTARGEEIAIALQRDQTLHDGAVLVLDEDYALVVRVATPRWLSLKPRDAAAALELGYQAGNLHWRVMFDGARLLVAQEGPVAAYRERLLPLIEKGAVIIDEDAQG